MTLGRSAGGPIGGWLTDTIGWRWYALRLCDPLLSLTYGQGRLLSRAP